MINTQLLDAKIEASGLKIGYIIEKLGLSRNGFDKKRKGINTYRVSEVYVLKDLLKLTDEDEVIIFYPEVNV